MTIDLNADKNYINGLEVQGNLIVEGKLYLIGRIDNCPEELLNTSNQNIVYNDTVTFKGDLFIHPTGKFKIAGSIDSKGFMNVFK